MKKIETYEVFVEVMNSLKDAQNIADKRENTKKFEEISYLILDIMDIYPEWTKKFLNNIQN